jgi:hypothetical protein
MRTIPQLSLTGQCAHQTLVELLRVTNTVMSAEAKTTKTAPQRAQEAMRVFGGKDRLYSSCTAAGSQRIRKQLKEMEPTNGLEPLTC